MTPNLNQISMGSPLCAANHVSLLQDASLEAGTDLVKITIVCLM